MTRLVDKLPIGSFLLEKYERTRQRSLIHKALEQIEQKKNMSLCEKISN